MNDDATFVRDVIACVRKLRAMGEMPNVIRIDPQLLRVRPVRGTSKEKKRARFYQRKRLAFFAAQGLTVHESPAPRRESGQK